MVITCSSCHKQIQAPPESVGKHARCPYCGATVAVPQSLPAARPPQMIAPPPFQQFHQQQPVILVNAASPQQPRLNAPGWFARSFMSTAGVMLAVLAFFGVGTALLCGGCLYIGASASMRAAKREVDAQDKVLVLREGETKVESGTYAKKSDTVSVGPISATLVSAKIGRVPLLQYGRRTGESTEDLLMVTISLRNTSASKRVAFRGWPANKYRGNVELKDEHGNRYKFIDFGITSKVIGNDGEDDGKSIDPGESAKAVIVFERPIAAAAQLFLVLGGDSIGESADSKLRWKIEHRELE